MKGALTTAIAGIGLGIVLIMLHQPLAHIAWKFHLPQVAGVFNTNDAKLSAQIGEYYFSQEHYDSKLAAKFYERSIRIDPSLPNSHYQLGRLYFLAGWNTDALWQIEQELVVNPTFGKSYYMKGLILGYMGKYPESAQAFGKFITTDPINWAGYNDLSWVYFSAGDFASAKQAAEVGLGYAENNPWLLNSLGVAELGLKDTIAARKAFAAALRSLETMGPKDWGRAYPGNDPRIYTLGYDSMKQSITQNLKKVQ